MNPQHREPFLGTRCRMRLPILGSVLRGPQTQFIETEAQNGGQTGVGWNPSEQAWLGPPVSEQKMPAGVPGEGGRLVSGPTPPTVPNIPPPRPCISHRPASVPARGVLPSGYLAGLRRQHPPWWTGTSSAAPRRPAGTRSFVQRWQTAPGHASPMLDGGVTPRASARCLGLSPGITLQLV